MFHKPDTRIHFVGIGGIGMSGIAEVLLTLGYGVSGTDLKESDPTRRLVELGATIKYGHDAAHLDHADVVVISSAVKPTNPEVVAARARGIPVIPRAEMLAELMRMKYGVAVAGSHGKTTTTSLVATVLHHAGLDPTAVIGGKLPLLSGSNARLGGGDYLVAEADESDGSFMKLSPTVAVVTNIDPEHLDHYGTLEALKRTFVDFINKVPFYGLAVLCIDHEHVQSILPLVEKRHVTYGFTPLATFRAVDVAFDGLRTAFTAIARGRTLGRVELAMPGRHNVLNSLAVLAVADFLGVDFAVYQRALAGFSGVGRRFTVRGEARGVMVVDDYGHHPAEIRATLAGARSGFKDRRIVAAFQPHRYTRTRDCFEDFVKVVGGADAVLLAEVYSAGEEPIAFADGRSLARAVRVAGKVEPVFVDDIAAMPEAIFEIAKDGDVVMCMGAGSIGGVPAKLVEMGGGA
ncbi:MAG TPA: UDP-N-acetylmuramate--L-alanine ligase [Polyangia bacterium]